MKKSLLLFLGFITLSIYGSEQTKSPLLKLKKYSPTNSRDKETVFTTIVTHKRLQNGQIMQHRETTNKETLQFFILSITYTFVKKHGYREAEITSSSYCHSEMSPQELSALMLNQMIARDRISIDAISRCEQEHNKHHKPTDFVENYLIKDRITTSYQKIATDQKTNSPTKFPKIENHHDYLYS